MKIKFILLSLLVSISTLTSCAGTSATSNTPPITTKDTGKTTPRVSFDWEHKSYPNLDGFKQEINILRVSLQDHFVLPININGCKKVSIMAKNAEALAAVNGTFFDSSCTSRNYLKIDGQLISYNLIRKNGAAAILIDRNNEVSMKHLAKDEDPSFAVHGMGGFPQLLKDGNVDIQPKETTSFFTGKHPRTAIGIIDKNNIMIVTVDGRSSLSRGMTIKQWADYLHSLGLKDAINLDGGSSTTMWVDGEGLVNRPSNSSGEARVANSLAVFPQ
jgi:exopolysaccharide biosynthesis protein